MINMEKEISNGKKNLLIATDNFLPRWDGIARFLAEIIPRLKEDYNITVIAPNFEGEFQGWPDVKIIRIPLMFKVADLPVARFSYFKIKNEVKKSDIVFTQTIGPIGGLAIIAAKRKKKKIVSYIHSIDWDIVVKSISEKIICKKFIYKKVRKIAKKLYNKSNIILIPFKELEEVYEWNEIKTKMIVVPLGVNIDRFKPPFSKSESKKRFGIGEEKIVIGFHGRIGREKDLPTLFRAFLRIKKNYNNLILLIVGEGLGSITKKLEENKDIILAGKQDNVIPYLQAMDIYVLPSLTETTSLATLEAMSCGIPPICTPVGYVKDYIKEGENGFLFDKGDSYLLSKKMELLIENKNLRETMGVYARQTAVNSFSWNLTIERLKVALKIVQDTEK